MHPDLLLLAERLVVAMETMSQDVKNISAYVCDLNYSVSHLLKERREKEGTSLELEDGDNITPDIGAAREEAASKSQYEEEGGSSMPHIDRLEHEKVSFGEVANMNIDGIESSDDLSSVSNQIFTEEIKTEGQSETEENDELCDVHEIYDSDINNMGISEEITSQTLLESGGEDPRYDMHTSVSPRDLLNPSELVETVVFSPVPGKIDCSQAFSSSSANDVGTTHVTRLPRGDISVVRAQKMKCALQMKTAEKPCQSVSYEKISHPHGSLIDGVLQHSEERSFKCLVCEKSFTEAGNLRRHMRLHSGEKPFLCTECGKVFSRNDQLTIHMLSHTSEKHIVCSECGKAFSHNRILTSHMRVHTGEKPYKCKVCGSAFSQSGSLTYHMRTHTGEHPFACKNCGRRFNRLGHLQRHMRLVHGVASPVS